MPTPATPSAAENAVAIAGERHRSVCSATYTGSYASPHPPARCHVRCPPPTTHGARGSTGTATRVTAPATPAGASRRRPAVLPWRRRGEDLLRQLLPDGVSLVERARQPAQRRLLGRLHRQRRVGADPARPVERSVHQLVGLHDLVDEPQLERALGRERLGREQELHRRGERELARQTGGGAPTGEQPALGLHHAERGPRRGDADVDAAEHLHPAGQPGPVDGGDDRLVQPHVAQYGPVPSSSRQPSTSVTSPRPISSASAAICGM